VKWQSPADILSSLRPGGFHSVWAEEKSRVSRQGLLQGPWPPAPPEGDTNLRRGPLVRCPAPAAMGLGKLHLSS